MIEYYAVGFGVRVGARSARATCWGVAAGFCSRTGGGILRRWAVRLLVMVCLSVLRHLEV